MLGGATSYASSINAAGTVVGSSTTSGGDLHAFAYSHGLMTDLGTLGGARSLARVVNNPGQVAGDSTTPTSGGYDHAFLYSKNLMADLGTLGGNFSGATAINASGKWWAKAPRAAATTTDLSIAMAQCRTSMH